MKSFRLGGILAATAASLCVAAAPATASIDPVPSEESALTLLVWGPGSESRGVELRCDPPSGTHPDPLSACDALKGAAGDFTMLTSGSFACTMELRQVTAIAIGTWQGQTVRWSEEFSNPCVLRANTGPLFDF